MTVNSGMLRQAFAVQFADEHVAGKEGVPGPLGNDADGDAVALVGAGIAILDENIFALEIGEEAVLKRFKLGHFHGPVDFAPPDFVFAGGFADEELVFGEAPGVLAGADDQRPQMAEHAFVTADGFFIQGRSRQIPVNPAQVAQPETAKAFEFVV